VFAKEGVTRYDPAGDAFDPNLHNALFEVPDATKDPGTVAVVIKVGRQGGIASLAGRENMSGWLGATVRYRMWACMVRNGSCSRLCVPVHKPSA